MNNLFDVDERRPLWNDISIYSAWKGTVTRPVAKTYEIIASAENANAFRGLFWNYITIGQSRI